MPNPTPTSFWANYQLLETGDSLPVTVPGVYIPLDSFSAGQSGLLLAEANETTGDARKVLYQVLETAFTAYNAMPVETRPTKMTLARAESRGNAANSIRRTFTITFEETIVTTALTDE